MKYEKLSCKFLKQKSSKEKNKNKIKGKKEFTLTFRRVDPLKK